MEEIKENFTDTGHCTSGAHCIQCRMLLEGRDWRASLTKKYALPQAKIDFECPFGKTWIVTPAAEQVPVPETQIAQPVAAGDCGCKRRRRGG